MGKYERFSEEKHQISVVLGSFYSITNYLMQEKKKKQPNPSVYNYLTFFVCVRVELVFCSVFLSV